MKYNEDTELGQYLPYADYLRPETETKKLIRLHLEDPTHSFSEEEIREVQIGVAVDIATLHAGRL
jgi:hypothetical protein